MGPVPAIIGTVIGIEHIVAGILQIFGSPLGFFHVASQFLGILTGNDALLEALQLRLHAVAQRNGEIVTAAFLDGLDHFGSETIAVFKGAAVFVGTLVEEFNGKLVQQVTFMNSMHFHAVNAGIFAELGGLGKSLNDLMDLLLGHFRADDVRGPAGRLRGGRCQLMAGIDNGLNDSPGDLILVQGANQLGDGPGAAHTGGELDEKLGTGLMDLIHKYLQFFKHLGILPQPFAPEGIPQGGNTGDDQAHVVLCSLQEQLGGLLVKAAAGQLKPTKQGSSAHGAHDNAVFNLHIADLPGGK